MAEIPSDIASSAAQSGIRAKEVADAREAGRAGTANAADRQAKAIEESGTTVDTDDADSRVFADAEGTGSQGRPLEEEEAAGAEEAEESVPNGITRDDSGDIHVDIRA